jgi:copper oxidase (laccase) domain-containing protein
VGDDVTQPFADRFGPGPVTDQRHVDLWDAVMVAARSAGIGSVEACRLCTSCHPELFFSHRRDRGNTGRQALIARLDGA